MSRDYIPRNDEMFDILQNNVYAATTANASKWRIPVKSIAELDASRTRWQTAVAAIRNPALHTPAATQEKNDAKAAYTAELRPFIQGQVMHNPHVSDSERLSMGLPVYDKTRTPAQAPGSRTEMEIDFSQIAKHTLRVRDSELKGAGKPKHVIGFEVWRRVGGTAEPALEEMQLVAMAVRSPYTIEYTSGERGRTVWYATRWINSRGEKGPWSEIVSAIIA
ncbi:MAG: hypothetical protein LBK22_09485 [Tannerella sp.]|nr:hypothetical protein [Tannerella sp.]